MAVPLSNKKYPGLHKYCGQCRKDITGKCGQGSTKKPIRDCRYPDRHQYKIILYNKEGKRRTKNLATRDFDEAVRELLTLKAEINGETPNVRSEAARVSAHILPVPVPPVTSVPLASEKDNLLECMAVYVATLEGDETVVPAFRKRVRSKKHIADVKRTFTYFALALQAHGHDVEQLRIGDVSERMMEAFHNHLLGERELSNRSYNKAIGIVSSFYAFLKEEGHAVANPCAKIPHRAVGKDTKAITPEEYESLLEAVRHPELGIAQAGKEAKSYYRPWLADSFRVAYHTGRRNWELSRMQFADIHDDEEGNPIYIKIADHKVNQQKGIADTDPNAKFIHVPVTEELKEIIYQIGYVQYRGTSRYIIAGDDMAGRDSIKDVMARAFSHYYAHVGTRGLTLKSCRKRYITELSAEIGIENARHITKHSNLEVIGDHYIDDEQMVRRVARKFRQKPPHAIER